MTPLPLLSYPVAGREARKERAKILSLVYLICRNYQCKQVHYRLGKHTRVRQFLASEEKSPYLVAQAVWFTDNHALNRLITPLREEIVRGGKRS